MVETLKLAAPTGVAETQLVRAVKLLLDSHQALTIEIRDGTTKDVLNYLIHGEADMSLQGKVIKENGVVTRKIPYEEENELAVPIGHYSALRDKVTKEELGEILDTLPYVGRIGGNVEAAVEDWALTYLKKQGLYGRIRLCRLKVRSLEGAVRAVAAGMGFGIFPRGTVREICPNHIKGISLPGENTRRCFYISYRSGVELGNPLRELAKILGVQDLG